MTYQCRVDEMRCDEMWARSVQEATGEEHEDLSGLSCK
jgi:hypothetical protein